jgi:RNA polymerase sigma-70 factor (ECF subfamily)
MRPEIEQAVALLQEKRPQSLERALDLLQHTVFSFSMKVCGHRQDAEDTMQDVLLKAVPYLPKFTSPKALVVWLYTVAKNRCLMSRRRSKFAPKETLSLEELMPDRQELESLANKETSTPESLALRGETAGQVRQAVLKVPPQYRLVLVLHDMEELDTEEIARITGLRPGTVRVRLHRARLFVRNELTRGQTRRPRPPKPRRRPRGCKALFAALSEYLDGTLQEEMCRELEKHIQHCQPCDAFLDTLRATVHGIRKVSPAKPDPATAARVRNAILQQYRAALQSCAKTGA